MKRLCKNSLIVIILFGIAIYLPSCKKEATPPSVATTDISDITQSSALIVGKVTDDGGAEITEIGFCWDTSPNPTISSNKTSIGKGSGLFTGRITGLSAHTKYYIRAYATNSAGTSYGKVVSFMTNQDGNTSTVPTLTTLVVTSITSTTAFSGGTITDDGGEAVIVRGVCWSTDQMPTVSSSKTSDGDGSGSFVSYLTGLNPGTPTKYYVRAYATNIIGTGYGNEVSFTTDPNYPVPALPTLTTTEVTSITSTTAVSGGNVINEGGGKVTLRGVSISTIPDPYIYSDEVTFIPAGSGAGPFVGYLSGLVPGTTYYVRAYAINSAGIVLGSTVSFTTKVEGSDPGLNYGTISDIEGNVYKTILIGNQTWMAENLRSVKYNNGVEIKYVTGSNWAILDEPGYSWYNNDQNAYKNLYGAIYNWMVIAYGNVCPTGWHVPSQGEFDVLINYLGGEVVAGGKMKESAFTHWTAPNTEADNSSGWTALPGGYRSQTGVYEGEGSNGYFWSSEGFDWAISRYYMLSNSTKSITSNSIDANTGMSIRCIMD
jgi:uncharacterized protein (TIGR02145 family)